MTQVQQTVKLSRIQPGSNPRTYFDPSELDELVESIKANGVIQPILVRPIEDGRFEIIAGERRWRASNTAFGDDGEIPIMCVNVSQEQADVMALTENTIRANMSPTEEAEAANRVLFRCKGEKEEAAATLGWTVSTLERRLALMRLTPEARQALTERKIKVGHAELLAAVPQDRQNATLKKIIEHDIGVAQMKSQLGKLAHKLLDAVFDKTECGSCQFNSASQSALFGEHIGDGYCTNPGCFDAKTDGHIESIAVSMREEVPRVEVLRTSDGVVTIKLVAEGRLGVGEAQASQCKSCANFGCTVSALAGSVGEVEKSICFDSVCHTKKVQDNLKVENESRKAATKASAAVKAKGGDDKQAQAAAKKAADSTKKAAAPKASGTVSTKVKEYRLNVWRQVAAKVMFADPVKSACVLISLAISSKASKLDSSKISDALAKLTSGERSRHGLSLGYTAEVIGGADAKVRETLVTALAPSAMKACDETDATSVMTFLGVDLSTHWKLNEEFLKLLTKSEIEALTEETGIANAMGATALNKAKAGKRDEFIKAVLAVESFDYQGVVPKCMSYAKEQGTQEEAVVAVAGADSDESDTESDEEID
jgi:ParB family chromosome partitioning protein